MPQPATDVKVRDNHGRFSVLELDAWGTRDGLLPEESALIRGHLDPRRRTLEAGTGGGRIVRGMQALGFTAAEGFDYLPEMIDYARANDPSGTTRFEVHDATALGYDDESFAQAVYLMSFLALIESEDMRRRVLDEAFRILEPGGTLLLSVPCFGGLKDSRAKKALHGPYNAYLATLRRLRGSTASPQLVPPLRLGGKFNPGFVLDHGPYHYWYRPAEIASLLRGAGFRIDRMGSRAQVVEGAMSAGPDDMPPPSDNFVFLVCHKPG